MSRNARALLLLLACATITVALLRLRNSEESAQGISSSAQPAEDAAASRGELSAPRASDPAADVSNTSERANAAVSTALHGRVLTPEGTPADEDLSVGLVGTELHAPVLPDGSFSLPLPAGTQQGMLLLDADYLYLAEPVAFDLSTAAPVLEPLLGACIVVEVQLPGERAMLSEVAVEYFDRGLNSARESGVDSSGSALLRALPTKRGWRVNAKHPRLYDQHRGPLQLAPGQRLHLTLELIRGVRLAGHVRHADGSAASGATLIARNRSDTGMYGVDRAELVCDEDGSFELAGLRPGRTSLYAKLDGAAQARMETLHLKDGESRVDLELVLGASTRIAGHVRWPDGRPAPATEVAIYPQYGSGTTVRVTADRQGNFEAQVSTSPPYHVRAKGGLQDGPDSWGALLQDVTPGSEQLVLVLRLGNRVTGRVIDDAGEPVQKFSIKAVPLAGGSSQGRESVKGNFTSDGGVFDFERLADGHWALAASASGHGASEPVAIELPAQAGADWLLVLPRLASISGQVSGPDGLPLTSGEVRAPVGYSNKTTKIQDNGSFHMTGLPAGMHNLSAKDDASAWGPAQSIALAAGEERTGVNLTSASSASIHGILHASLTEREGRQVRLANMTYTFSASATADGEGRFHFTGLAPDDYRLYLDFSSRGGLGREWAEKYAARAELIVPLREAEERDVVLGGPAEGTITVHGQLSLAGAPLENQLVYVYPGKEGNDFPVTVGYAGAEGLYELHVPSAGDYAFSSAPSSDHPFGRRVSVPDHSPYEYDIALGQGSISGTLIGSDGNPRAARTLLLRRSAAAASSRRPGDLHRAKTDAEGKFHFANLEQGGWELRSSGGFRAQQFLSEGLAIRADLHLDDGEQLDSVEFRLRPGATLKGTCLRADGSPATGARIYVIYANGCQMLCWTGEKANWEGAFRVPGVDAGPIEVYAELGGVRTSSVNLELTAGASGYLDLAFD